MGVSLRALALFRQADRNPLHLPPETDEAKNARDEIYDGSPHESKLSHELVAGGAAFEAMKLFEDRQRKEGEFYFNCLLLSPPSPPTYLIYISIHTSLL